MQIKLFEWDIKFANVGKQEYKSSVLKQMSKKHLASTPHNDGIDLSQR